MNGDNIIKIRVDGEYFATAAEMVAFVGGRLAEKLELWPEKMNGRQRSVNLHNVIPREAVMYEVNYLTGCTGL